MTFRAWGTVTNEYCGTVIAWWLLAPKILLTGHDGLTR